MRCASAGLLIAALALAAVTACKRDETLTAYGAADRTWQMQGADLVLRFDASGGVTGRGPCNDITARQTAPYPWFALSDVQTTERACPDLAAEAETLDRLRAMRLAEVAGNTLILSDDTGAQMVFRAE